MPQRRKRQAALESSPTAKYKSRSALNIPPYRPSRKKAYNPGDTCSVRSVPYDKLTLRQKEARAKSLHVLTLVRHGVSFSEAAKLSSVTPRTVKLHVGSALVQDRKGGRLRASKGDSFVRFLTIPGPHGQIDVVAHGSKEATEFAKYASAVGRYLSGDSKALADYHGKKIAGIELLTAGRSLKALADVAALPTSLYRAFSAGAA